MITNDLFNSGLKSIHDLMEAGKAVSILEEDEDARFLESLHRHVDQARFSEDLDETRTIVYNALDEHGWSLDDYYDIYVSDPDCRDVAVPITAMAEAIHDIRNDILFDDEDEDGDDELRNFGKFVWAATIALATLFEQAEESGILEQPLIAIHGQAVG